MEFELKVIGFLAVIFWLFRRERILERQQVFVGLVLLYSFAYIYSPYWHVFYTVIPLKYSTLLGLFIGGVIWSSISSAKLIIPKLHLSIGQAALLTLALYAINYVPLQADIAWRGDEDFHMQLVWRLSEYLQFYFQRMWALFLQYPLFFVLAMAFAYAVFVLAVKISKKSLFFLIPISAIILFPTNIFKDPTNPLLLSKVLRYPMIEKWIVFLFVTPSYFTDVRLYRIVPFLSIICISWIITAILNQKLSSKLTAVFIALLFVTIPLSLYYSSILYLEMPLVLLQLIVLTNIQQIITQPRTKLMSRVGYYALLISAFLKETGVIFCLVVLSLRFIYSMVRYVRTHRFQFLIQQELTLVFSILLPAATYFVFRKIFNDTSNFHFLFYFPNILALKNYAVFIESIWTQTGGMLPLFIVGLWLVWREERSRLLFWVVVSGFVVTTLFFMACIFEGYVNEGNSLMLLGYSRWNLYLLPFLWIGGIWGILRMNHWFRMFALGGLLLLNIFLLPFNHSGIRKPAWGSLMSDMAEYTYPYALTIKEVSLLESKKIALVGQYSPYGGLEYYLQKFYFHPEIIEYPFGDIRFSEASELQKLKEFEMKLQSGELKMFQDVDIIVYHSIHKIEPPHQLADYTFYRQFDNSEHRLVVFIQ